MGFHNTSGAGLESMRDNIKKTLDDIFTISVVEDWTNNTITVEDAIKCGYIVINEDLSIIINHQISISVIKDIPDTVKLVKLYNISVLGENITTLKGLPKNVYGDLTINSCTNLNSLDYCPDYVSNDFNIINTPISTLKHGPKHVGKNYFIENVKILDLQGLPQYIYGTLTINQDLDTLKGFPKVCKTYSLRSLNNYQDFCSTKIN